MPTIAQTAGAPVAVDHAEELLYRKVLKRILPLLLLCYVVAYLDRVNVGFAKLQMLDSLGLSDAVYAVGASIAYAYVPAELAEPGTRMAIDIFGEWVGAEIRPEPLYDPKGERLRA